MNNGFPFRAFIFTFILFLGACGGSDNSPPDNSTPDTVSGTAQAPSGSVARLAVDKPLMLAALDFFMPPTWAAVTGLSPVANATVELVRIDDDGSQTPGCILSASETFTENMPAPGLDIPFNCTNYPICTQDDFNGEISGTDQDNRQFTSTYSFNSQTNVLTYVKSVEGSIFTETITIQSLANAAN